MIFAIVKQVDGRVEEFRDAKTAADALAAFGASDGFAAVDASQLTYDQRRTHRNYDGSKFAAVLSDDIDPLDAITEQLAALVSDDQRTAAFKRLAAKRGI